MKIDHHIVSIPPYISTSWDHVRSLSVKDHILVISLNDGEIIRIPGLSDADIENIFTAHAQWLEADLQQDALGDVLMDTSTLGIGSSISDQGKTSFSLSLGGFAGMQDMSGLSGMGMVLEHNAAQAGAPNLPQEVLQRVGTIGRMMLPEGSDSVPVAEPHCNCYFCQIARAIHGETAPALEAFPKHEVEEKVDDKDLSFCQWEIRPLGEQVFEVINRLDTLESYKVCLHPRIGCTCGHEGCEHIIAVLKS